MPQPANRRIITEATLGGASLSAAVGGSPTNLVPRVASLESTRTSLAYKYPADYGLDTSGTTTHTAAQVQAWLDAGVPLGAGVIKCSGSVVIKGDAYLSRLTINYTGTGTAVTVGTSSVLFRKHIELPNVVAVAKTTTGWTQVAGSVGVRLLNLNSCMVTVPWISNFETGLSVRGEGQGNVYQTIILGHLDNNKRNIVLDADLTGWSNQNLYLGGRCSHNSTEGTNVSGTRHVLMTTGLANPINNNTFLNTSFEGDTPEYHVDVAGSVNSLLNCRWEVTGGARVRWQADAADNTIRDGYKADSIVSTVVAGALRNKVQAGSRIEFIGTSSVGLLRLQNTSSDANPALLVFGAASLADTDWRWKFSGNQLEAKRVAETGNRVILDGNNGRLYLGTGTAAPAMYWSATSTSGLTCNGGNLYSGTDNTYDIGLASSLRFRDLNLGRNAVIGGTLGVTGNVGFYGTSPAAKPTVSGSRGGNAALASLLTALAGLGLITDSTTA